MAGFIVLAVAAVCTTIAARFSLVDAAVAALVALAVLCTAVAHYDRRRPASFKIGPDGLTVWNGAGRQIAQGRVAGCAQWSGSLLSIALVGDNGRTHTLLVVADMLRPEPFRELAVEARRAAHGAL